MAPTADVEMLQTVYDEVFNADDADLALVCTSSTKSTTTGDAIKHQQHVFKVHRKVLAAPSTFFEDMMAISKDSDGVGEIRRPDALPEVRMDESSSIVKVLLGAAYNKPELFVGILRAPEWKFALGVCEAANKYSFHVLKALSSTVLLLCSPAVDDQGSLKIYTRASMFDDASLASVYLEKASNVPLHHTPMELLGQMPPSALMKLIIRHRDRDRAALDKMTASLTPRSSCSCKTIFTVQVTSVMDQLYPP